MVVTSAPCEAGPMSITLHAPISIPQAREICTVMQKRTTDAYYVLDGRWRFEIRSPYAAGQSIAWCWL
jgi:hypothetical protein